MKNPLAPIILFTMLAYPATAGSLSTPSFPPDRGLSQDWSLRVRTLSGGAWQPVVVLTTPIDANHPAEVSVGLFDFTGPVEVEATWNRSDEALTNADVVLFPRAQNIQAVVNGPNTFLFRLDQPRQVTCEVRGLHHATLHLLTNTEVQTPPLTDGPGLLYFGPGVHTAQNDPRIKTKTLKNKYVNRRGEWVKSTQVIDVLTVPSNTRVFLAPGAILEAKILIKNARNVIIEGRGLIDQRKWTDPGVIEAIEVNHSTDVTIRDITVLNGNHYCLMIGESSRVDVRRFKGFSDKIYGDGIDMMSSTEVTIDDVFLRTYDDCLAVYGQRVWEGWSFRGDTRGLKVTNAILWPDIAHGINIGCHGNLDTGPDGQPMGNILEDLSFRNIDILYHNNEMRDPNLILEFQGTLAIDVGDNNVARNILFEDVRVERILAGQLVHFVTMDGKIFGGKPGRRVENIMVRNLSYTGDADHNDAPSRIKGLARDRVVKGITFENFKIGGTLVRSAEEGHISIEEHASDVRFLVTGP